MLSFCRTLSVDLYFKYAPKDLMSKFIDCLVRLPNLRTLEIFSTSHLSPITRGLKRKSARFPSVRELAISNRTAKFIGSCPNVETVIAPDLLTLEGATILSSHGKGLEKLKRVIGVAEESVRLGKLKDISWFPFTEGASRKWRRVSRTSKRLASKVALGLFTRLL